MGFLCGFFFVWAFIATLIALRKFPLPIPDWGHRVFPVKNLSALKALYGVLGEFGFRETFTFDTPPLRQTLLSDGTTVIARRTDIEVSSSVPNLPGMSIVVPGDPFAAATEAAISLHVVGFKAHAQKFPGLEDRLAFLTSDAFVGWVLVFRKHALKMGPPPGRRKILR